MASGITINSNLAALNAQRRLDVSTQAVQQSFTRLSSGLRINKASDDAAGLAISESLNVDARVYAQGIRNLNDGISLTNIAEGAMQELTNITIRQRELATQSANGTLSLAQRQALNQEANALVDEFNRITQSTDFNGIKLLDKSLAGLRVQAGYGVDGSVSFEIADELARKVGTGSFGDPVPEITDLTFQDPSSIGDGSYFCLSSPSTDYFVWFYVDGSMGDPGGPGTGIMVDISACGSAADVEAAFESAVGSAAPGVFSISSLGGGACQVEDVAGGSASDAYDVDSGTQVTILQQGNSDGPTHYSTGTAPHSVTLGDLNGDGVLDIVTADEFDSKASVFLGKRDGTFYAGTSFSTGSLPFCVTLGDLNGDGVLDMVTADATANKASVLLGNGDGSFHARTSFSTGSGSYSVTLGDLNNDGVLDIVTGDGMASVLLGNGDGSFHARTSFSTGSGPWSVTLGDLNSDGVLDMVTADGTVDKASVFLGNGDGSFRARTSFSTGSDPHSVVLGDLNGDGVLDMVTADYNENKASVFLGNGDGSFHARTSFSTGSGPRSVTLGDLNNDGVVDMVTADLVANKASVFLGKGNGSFHARTSFSTGSFPISVTLGDLNGNGVLDMVTADLNSNSISVFLAVTTEVTTTPHLNLCTRQGALDAMATIDATLQHISSELGSIGSIQSRLGVAVNTLSVSRENYLSAKSQITDADVSQESAQLIKNQILQQAGAAVLAQANQAPALALMLLRGS
jgi:flagellin-like hook-associated protein FlgL